MESLGLCGKVWDSCYMREEGKIGEFEGED